MSLSKVSVRACTKVEWSQSLRDLFATTLLLEIYRGQIEGMISVCLAAFLKRKSWSFACLVRRSYCHAVVIISCTPFDQKTKAWQMNWFHVYVVKIMPEVPYTAFGQWHRLTWDKWLILPIPYPASRTDCTIESGPIMAGDLALNRSMSAFLHEEAILEKQNEEYFDWNEASYSARHSGLPPASSGTRFGTRPWHWWEDLYGCGPIQSLKKQDSAIWGGCWENPAMTCSCMCLPIFVVSKSGAGKSAPFVDRQIVHIILDIQTILRDRFWVCKSWFLV